MSVSASDVKALRDRTGLGFMDCKAALQETGGDLDEAEKYLRKKGLASSSKRSQRAASEGAVGAYIHMGGKIGVLLEVNCETDFVARNADFQQLVKDIAMHVAATSPKVVSRDEVTPELLAQEREIYREQALGQGKPENIVGKIVDGKMEKFYEENCLLEQPFVKDTGISVKELIANHIAKIGENIVVRRFTRYALGEQSQ
ncbi:MAG: translation elongation factor Ts [Acidobacteriota bacterium]|jgi:elongation factor Ts